RYNPHAVSLSFFATYVDSLLAIQWVCFEKRICTIDEFLAAVRNNWKGAEWIRAEVLKAPHWGDGRPETEALARRVVDEFLEAMADIPNERGGHYQLGVWIYREIKSWGVLTPATPDGRHDGDELSQSLCPSHFRNDAALTTVLRSLASIDLTRLAGNSVTNICIERKQVSSDTIESILRTFARLNLQLLQLNCLDSNELEEARKHPEKYQHLIVRICGFSAKFVSLCPEWQQEVIDRHKY
ncbi:MAG: hypothetical protein J6X55_11155, partial [Victivallales bacterium]|nr:hypothetical protein [Victivallales bacterium]